MSEPYDTLVDGTKVNADWLDALPTAVGAINTVGFHPVSDFAYKIFKIGSNYYRRDGSDGEIDDSGTVLSTLINDAITATTAPGRVVVVGGTPASPYDLAETISLKDYVTFDFDVLRVNHAGDGFDLDECIRVELNGMMIKTKTAYAGDLVNMEGTYASTVRIKDLDLTNSSGSGILLKPKADTKHCTANQVFVNHISVGEGYGIYFGRAAAYQCIGNDIFLSYMDLADDNGTGIYFYQEGYGNNVYNPTMHCSVGTVGCKGIHNVSAGKPKVFGLRTSIVAGNEDIDNGGVLFIIGAELRLDRVTNSATIHYTNIYDMAASKFIAYWDDPAVGTFDDDDLTPSVAGLDVWKTATGHAAAKDITMFNDGHDGQVVTIVSSNPGNATTVKDGGNLLINGDWVDGAEKTLKLVFDGTNWYEICRR